MSSTLTKQVEVGASASMQRRVERFFPALSSKTAVEITQGYGVDTISCDIKTLYWTHSSGDGPHEFQAMVFDRPGPIGTDLGTTTINGDWIAGELKELFINADSEIVQGSSYLGRFRREPEIGWLCADRDWCKLTQETIDRLAKLCHMKLSEFSASVKAGKTVIPYIVISFTAFRFEMAAALHALVGLDRYKVPQITLNHGGQRLKPNKKQLGLAREIQVELERGRSLDMQLKSINDEMETLSLGLKLDPSVVEAAAAEASAVLEKAKAFKFVVAPDKLIAETAEGEGGNGSA